MTQRFSVRDMKNILTLSLLALALASLSGCAGADVRTQELVHRSADAPPRWLAGVPITPNSLFIVGRGESWLAEGGDEAAAQEAAIDEAFKDAAVTLVDTHLTQLIADTVSQVLLPVSGRSRRPPADTLAAIRLAVIDALVAQRLGVEGWVGVTLSYEERYKVREGSSELDGLLVRRFVLFDVNRPKTEEALKTWVESSPSVQSLRQQEERVRERSRMIVEKVDAGLKAADEARFMALASTATEVARLQKELDEAISDYRDLSGTLPPVDLEAAEEAARRIRMRAAELGRQLLISFEVHVSGPRPSARERGVIRALRNVLQDLNLPETDAGGRRCGVGATHWL